MTTALVPRTVFVIASLQRGGSEGQLVELISHLAPRLMGARVATIAAEADAEHLEALEDGGVEVCRLAPSSVTGVRRLTAAGMRLDRLLRRTEAELVYAWGPHATMIGVPLAHRLGIPAIVARRQVALEGRRRLTFDRLVSAVEARAELVTANSAAVTKDALSRGIAPSRLRIVRNGHRVQERLPTPPPDPVVLGYVAAFRPGKGHDRLLAAIPYVHAGASWRVDLAGGGPLLERVRDEVQARQLDHRVRVLGMVRDVHEFWRSRHAAVLLSGAEGSSNALIEAGLAGRPLLATAVAGNSELIPPGAGVLVPPDDPVATAGALGRLIDDPRLRERLGQAAHEHMRTFDVATMAEGHLRAMVEAHGEGVRRRYRPGA
ncbi:MAG: glycosyltransferase, partial [Solirubrobacteraceae bacterium]